MNQDDKKTKNKIYYLKNRAQILKRAQKRNNEKKSQSAVAHVIPIRPSQKIIKKKIVKEEGVKVIDYFSWILEPLALVIAISLSTYFLLRETALFLTDMDASGAGWLKAILAETLIVLLCWIKPYRISQNALRIKLLITLFVYQGFSIVGGVLNHGEMKLTANEIARRTANELEQEMAQAENLKLEAHDSGRITLARKYERKIDSLRQGLTAARAEMLKVPSENLKVTFFSFAFFRLLVMLTNSFLIGYFATTFSKRPSTGLRIAVG